MARIVRLGYNTLSLDPDGHLSDDPYAYLKAPPLDGAHLVTMTHGGWSGMTAGFVYAQNASADGPVAWALAEVVDRVRSCNFESFGSSDTPLHSPGTCLT